jgi:site-specific DNA-cytosine methylase
VVEPSTFVKSRLAQSVNDHETWVESDVTPTLNVFDVGDVRATTAIVEPILLDGRRVDDVRVYSEPVQTLQERMGTGGNNVPVVAQDTTVFTPSAARKGGQVWEGVVPTLRAEAKQGDNTHHVIQETILLRNREGKPGGGKGPLISEDVSLTLGTSNNQTLFQTTLSFDTQFGSNANVFEDQAPTLKASQQPPSVTQNPIVIDRAAYNQGENARYEPVIEESQTMTSLVARGPHAVGHDNNPTLIVRRLTPLECERLMGWPDNHTAQGTNGAVSDTNRYKMCGNGIASPVAQWIAKHILATRPDAN